MNTIEKYTPEKLRLWSMPDSWFGTPWDDYYTFLGRNRESDCLAESNFRSVLKAIGGEKVDDDGKRLVAVVRESHFAVGWIEWIAIHISCHDVLRIADDIAAQLEDYPVFDESDCVEMENEEAQRVWQSCYTDRERVEYIREYRSQFDFRYFADLLGCARGKFFLGHASELLQ